MLPTQEKDARGVACNCFVARHPKAGEIDAALREPKADILALADRYRVSKTVLYEHRRHLREADAGQPAAPPEAPRDLPAVAGEQAGQALAEGSEEAAQQLAAETAPASPAEPPAEKPARVSTRSVRDYAASTENEAGFRGNEGEVAEKQLTPGQSPARAQPQVVETKGGIVIPQVHGTAYLTAVEHCAEAITRGMMRPAVLQGIAQRLGLTRDRVRQAFYEAARHLRLDMGGLLERQEASIAWVLRQRNEAQAKAEAREKMADEWRQKERRAHDVAQGIGDEEARVSALGEAARMGLVASKYGLEAEKWAAQALSHQKHLDDIQCLIGPKEVNFNQFNQGGGDGATFARFAAALARRFRDRPDILAELEAAAAELERAGDEPILVESEAA